MNHLLVVASVGVQFALQYDLQGLCKHGFESILHILRGLEQVLGNERLLKCSGFVVGTRCQPPSWVCHRPLNLSSEANQSHRRPRRRQGDFS